MVPSARARSSSSMAGACSGVVTARISTLSNSWARSMPRVSRPAEPASRRKHGVYAISRTGRRSSSIVSSRYSDVSGTSAVGIAHRSSRSIVKASSANFGSWPEAVSVAVVTSDGGRISSKRVGVAVEGELAQGPTHRGAEAAGHREHRPADLDRPLVVEDAEGGPGLPVRHLAVGGERRRAGRPGRAPPGCRRRTRRRGRRGGAGWGCPAGGRAGRRRSRRARCRAGARRSPRARLSAAERFGGRDVAVAPQLADLASTAR